MTRGRSRGQGSAIHRGKPAPEKFPGRRLQNWKNFLRLAEKHLDVLPGEILPAIFGQFVEQPRGHLGMKLESIHTAASAEDLGGGQGA